MRRANFQGNVLVSNLPEEITPAELAALFDDYGLVLGAMIRQIPSNAGQIPLGIIALAPEAGADRAIEALHGTLLGTRKLKVQKARPRPKSPKSPVTAAAIEQPSAPPAQGLEKRDAAMQTAGASKVIVEYRSRGVLRSGRSLRPATLLDRRNRDA
jgi:RNA recognition motif-containing protein